MSHNSPNFEYIQDLYKQSPSAVAPNAVSRTIYREVKNNKNFEKGKKLFDIFVEILKRKKKNSNRKYQYSNYDINAIQKALSALVRYAPSPAQARYYFCTAFSDYEEPARTVPFELTLINKLLYVCSVNANDEENMKNSLDLIKTALEIGIFYVDIPDSYTIENAHFQDPREAFENSSKKGLKHFRLEFNEDKTGLQPLNKK